MEERPIDRGWAWVICFAVAVNSMFFSGPLRSYGILFVEIRRRFNTSGTATSLVLAMISVGMAITSPGAATLGERYGQRRILVVGGALMALAAFLTAFSPNVLYVAIVFGGLTGLGLGCVFTPSVTMIGYYFDQRRSLANGISSAGGSVGQLTIPVLFTYLMDEYGFQGGLLIFSAFLLHVIPFSMLVRPVTAYLPLRKSEAGGVKAGVKAGVNEGVKEVVNEGAVVTVVGEETDVVVEAEGGALMENGAHAGDVAIRGGNEKERAASNGAATKNATVTSVPLLRIQQLADEDTRSLHAFPSHLHETNLTKTKGTSMPFLHRVKSHDTGRSHEDVSMRGSSYFLPAQPLSPAGNDSNGAAFSHSKHPAHHHNNEDDDDDDDDEESQSGVRKKKRGALTSMLCFCCNLYDWQMFRDPVFIFYCISMTACQSGYMSVCMFLPPFAEEKGVDKYNVALLLSLAGLVTLFGRIGGGWFADLKLVARPYLSGVCVIIVGIFAALLPVFPVYPYMVAYVVVLGFVGGTFVALIVSVVIDLLGIDKMASAFGLSLMISGLVTIPLPLLLGVLKDVTGTFDWSIWLCSILLVIGGSFTIFTQHYVTKKRREAGEILD